MLKITCGWDVVLVYFDRSPLQKEEWIELRIRIVNRIEGAIEASGLHDSIANYLIAFDTDLTFFRVPTST